MTKRPSRQHRGDRLTDLDAGPKVTTADYALAPFDRLATKMDDKWGIDRLPELVSVETAAKYGSAIGKLNDALAGEDVDTVKTYAQVCMRGLAAMNTEAEAAGHVPEMPTIIETEFEGVDYGIVADVRDWKLAKAARPNLAIVTLRELLVAYTGIAKAPVYIDIVSAFPGAELIGMKKTPLSSDDLTDPIPF